MLLDRTLYTIARKPLSIPLRFPAFIERLTSKKPSLLLTPTITEMDSNQLYNLYKSLNPQNPFSIFTVRSQQLSHYGKNFTELGPAVSSIVYSLGQTYEEIEKQTKLQKPRLTHIYLELLNQIFITSAIDQLMQKADSDSIPTLEEMIEQGLSAKMRKIRARQSFLTKAAKQYFKKDLESGTSLREAMETYMTGIVREGNRK